MKIINFNISNIKKFILSNKEVILYIFLCTLIYFLFFKNIFSYQFNFWNSDAMIKMFPVRVYLYEKLSNYEFPFWTERVFLGYSLYQDIENGLLNPINLLLIFLFGPVGSLKILHFSTFLFGSVCLYLLSKKLYSRFTILGALFSVVSYYFSFFHINHLIHMNIVLISMLLPIHIYLAYLFKETREFRYLIFQVLLFSYGILWGQPQISFFNLAGISIFYFFIVRNINDSIKYLFILVFFTFSLTLFQLLPSFYAYKDSQRVGEIVKYTEFTNSPTVLINNIFPFSLGYYQNFLGNQVSGAFSFVETYNYISIVSFILLIFYLIFGQTDRNYRFVIFTIYFYLFFTFLGNFFWYKYSNI